MAMTAQPRQSQLKYRPDIDGLRAIAVLLVMAFHAFPGRVKGGLIGVDVFFVISGFLISTIIFDSLENGTFSFYEFYARRIKRIFPALFVVLAVSYAFGWFFLLPDEYKRLGKHIAAGAGFLSNIILWQEAGYFDSSAETKPLLHLWSLGIEEQFYLLWPALLWLAWKRKFNLAAVVAIVSAASFYLNLRGVSADVVATFYSPQTRMWELASGAFLAYTGRYDRGDHPVLGFGCRFISNAAALVGASALICGLCVIDSKSAFPGYWAVLPVVGAACTIWAGPRAWINRAVLSNRLMVSIGLISYPLYLWHWPLLSFARIVEGGAIDDIAAGGLLALTFLLAWCTYAVVEKPLRSPIHQRVKVVALVVLLAAVGISGYGTFRTYGLGLQQNDKAEFLDYFENSSPGWKFFKKLNIAKAWRYECGFFNASKYLDEGKAEDTPVAALDPSCYARDSRFEKSVMIWGDSHAQMLSPGIVGNIPKNWQVLQVASPGCNIDPNIRTPSTTSQCDQTNYFAMKTIERSKPDVVVVAQAKGHSLANMADISAHLRDVGIKKILFLGPVPQWKSALPKIIARFLWLTKPERTFVLLDQDIMTNNEKLSREFPPSDFAQYVDVISLFCISAGCLTRTGSDIQETITTWDYGHLTPPASNYLAQRLLLERIILTRQ